MWTKWRPVDLPIGQHVCVDVGHHREVTLPNPLTDLGQGFRAPVSCSTTDESEGGMPLCASLRVVDETPRFVLRVGELRDGPYLSALARSKGATKRKRILDQ